MNSNDRLYRFLFENNPVRGELVQLEQTWQAVCQRREYPEFLRHTLGEFMAAAALLSATLKFEGSLIIQAQGKGPVSLMVVECSHDRVMRATAKWSHEFEADTLQKLIGEGQLVITIDRGNNPVRYQGIVELRGASVAEVLENYLLQSEQLDTHIWLAADNHRAAGLLIQKLPESDTSIDTWETVKHLSATITNNELLSLEPETIIHRLYHEEDVRLFEPESVRFGCSCTRERVINALRTIGYDEVNSIIREQGNVDIDCEFCGQHYQFDAVDIEQIFASAIIEQSPKTQH